MHHSQKIKNSGMTLIETMVSSILLTTALGLVVQYRAQSMNVLHNLETQARALRAITSLREQIGAWEYSRVTAEAIRAIPMYEELVESHAHTRWVANVVEVDEPIVGKRVTLGVEWFTLKEASADGTHQEAPTQTSQTLEFWLMKKTVADDEPRLNKPDTIEGEAKK